MPELCICFQISEELAGTTCFLLTVETSMALAQAEPVGGRAGSLPAAGGRLNPAGALLLGWDGKDAAVVADMGWDG